MESKVFKIDEIDRNIIEIIQKDPMLTHTEIAKKVNRSQPTIGMRIRKLEKTGVLKFQAGINIKTMDLILARVEIQTLKPDDTIKLVKNCPYMLNAFRLSGASNLSILIISDKVPFFNRHLFSVNTYPNFLPSKILQLNNFKTTFLC